LIKEERYSDDSFKSEKNDPFASEDDSGSKRNKQNNNVMEEIREIKKSQDDMVKAHEKF
jgi:hypothetical protein